MTARQYKIKALTEITTEFMRKMAQEYIDSFSEEAKKNMGPHFELMRHSYITGMHRCLNILPESEND